MNSLLLQTHNFLISKFYPITLYSKISHAIPLLLDQTTNPTIWPSKSIIFENWKNYGFKMLTTFFFPLSLPWVQSTFIVLEGVTPTKQKELTNIFPAPLSQKTKTKKAWVFRELEKTWGIVKILPRNRIWSPNPFPGFEESGSEWEDLGPREKCFDLSLLYGDLQGSKKVLRTPKHNGPTPYFSGI